MKQLMTRLLIFSLLAGLWTPCAAVGAPTGARYDIVIPLAYDSITDVASDCFVTEKDGVCTLRAMDGGALLTGKQSISIGDGWCLALQDGKYGLFRHDGTQIIPCRYSRILPQADGTAIAVDGKEYIRPGSWYGDLCRYDLSTGRITEDLGYGWEGDYPFYSPETSDSSEDPVIQYTGSSDGWGSTGVMAYGAGGQLLLDFTPYCGSVYNELHADCGLLIGYADNGGSLAMNYAFSARGRLLASRAGCSFVSVMGGQYLLNPGDLSIGAGMLLLDGDGNPVADQNTFDRCVYNPSGNRCYPDSVEGGDLLMVSKDGYWGAIRMKPYAFAPDSWAQTEATNAADAGFVPEEIRQYWRDGCTRAEFCQMLAPLVRRYHPEPPAASPAAQFDDCTDGNVLLLAAWGIVEGVGNGNFHPDFFLTRQEAAVMLARAAGVLGLTVPDGTQEFDDADDCAPWSLEAVQTVSNLRSKNGTAVMQGTGDGRFSPLARYTVEQSAVTVWRLSQAL